MTGRPSSSNGFDTYAPYCMRFISLLGWVIYFMVSRKVRNSFFFQDLHKLYTFILICFDQMFCGRWQFVRWKFLEYELALQVGFVSLCFELLVYVWILKVSWVYKIWVPNKLRLWIGLTRPNMIAVAISVFYGWLHWHILIWGAISPTPGLQWPQIQLAEAEKIGNTLRNDIRTKKCPCPYQPSVIFDCTCSVFEKKKKHWNQWHCPYII